MKPAALEVVRLEHLPAECLILLGFFQSVENAGYLHEQLLSRNSEFEYAFVDAAAVASRRQLLAAVYKAVNAKLEDRLRTPNVHSETVICLNPSSNISEAYRRFGISRESKDVLVVKICIPSDGKGAFNEDQVLHQTWDHLSTNVKGTAMDPSQEHIAAVTDWSKVRKYYKINGLGWLDKLDKDKKAKESELLVLGAMALRGL